MTDGTPLSFLPNSSQMPSELAWCFSSHACHAACELQGRAGAVAGSKRAVIDGPFAETKELVAGFWLWQCRSREEAIEWLKRAPFDEGTEVEIRQIFEAADFGAEFTPELRAQEERQRAEIDARNKK